MLNPSAGGRLPAGYPAQDYDRLLERIAAAGMGAIGIRVLAGGALSGEAARHPIASSPPDPIGPSHNYQNDLDRARRLQPLVIEGHAATLPEAGLRFAIAQPAISTVLIGIATVEQFDQAIAAANKGGLGTEALRRLAELQQGFAGESR